jgi:hypothetical protein
MVGASRRCERPVYAVTSSRENSPQAGTLASSWTRWAAAPAAVKTFREWADEYRASRVDLAPATRDAIQVRTATLFPLIGDLDAAQITPATVANLVTTLELKPSSLRRYIATLAAILDYAGIEPNPAKDKRVRLPREERTIVEPPSADAVALIVTRSPGSGVSLSRHSQRRVCGSENSTRWSGATST